MQYGHRQLAIMLALSGLVACDRTDSPVFDSLATEALSAEAPAIGKSPEDEAGGGASPLSRPVSANPKTIEAALRNGPADTGSILVNQHAIPARARIRATLLSPSLTALPVVLYNDRDQIVRSGETVPFGLDPQSGLSVHQIDLSSNGLIGRGFTLRSGLSQSDPFDVLNGAYAALARDSLNYFYQSRYADPVEAAYVPSQTPALTRGAGHLDAAHSCFSGLDTRGTNWPGCDYALDIQDGWYDAGDYGQYAVNTGVATWMMFNMAEAAKQSSPRYCRSELGDQSLPMPEAGNGQSDILDEARHGMDYLLSLQVLSSTPQAVAKGAQPASGPLTLTLLDASGMVHHKSHGIRWPGDQVLATTDTIPRRLYPPTTSATLHLAATGALCSRRFARIDPVYAQQCLTAAETAYAAAKRHPDIYAWNEFTGGGPYDDRRVSDEFGWAATELWLATGNVDYEADILTYVSEYDVFSVLNWQQVEAKGMLSLALITGTDHPLVLRAKDALTRWADQLVQQSGRSAFMIPYDFTAFNWGSNGDILNRAVILGSAYRVSGKRDHYQGVVDAMDYVLGRNAMGRSYVSGYGERPMRNPHHRFWRNGEDPSLPAPPPGVLSGGPNSVNFIDPVGSTLRGQCTGMTCYRDIYASYSMNEVAINWNASLAWVAHWLDRQSRSCASDRGSVDGAE